MELCMGVTGEKLLYCLLCCEPVRQPQLLPSCQHVFCRPCWLSYRQLSLQAFTVDYTNTGVVDILNDLLCPVCSSLVDIDEVKSALPSNHPKTGLFNDVRLVAEENKGNLCTSCDSGKLEEKLCATCLQSTCLKCSLKHQQQNHVIWKLPNTYKTECYLHRTPVESLCNTCNKLICRTCHSVYLTQDMQTGESEVLHCRSYDKELAKSSSGTSINDKRQKGESRNKRCSSMDDLKPHQVMCLSDSVKHCTSQLSDSLKHLEAEIQERETLCQRLEALSDVQLDQLHKVSADIDKQASVLIQQIQEQKMRMKEVLLKRHDQVNQVINKQIQFVKKGITSISNLCSLISVLSRENQECPLITNYTDIRLRTFNLCKRKIDSFHEAALGSVRTSLVFKPKNDCSLGSLDKHILPLPKAYDEGYETDSTELHQVPHTCTVNANAAKDIISSNPKPVPQSSSLIKYQTESSPMTNNANPTASSSPQTSTTYRACNGSSPSISIPDTSGTWSPTSETSPPAHVPAYATSAESPTSLISQQAAFMPNTSSPSQSEEKIEESDQDIDYNGPHQKMTDLNHKSQSLATKSSEATSQQCVYLLWKATVESTSDPKIEPQPKGMTFLPDGRLAVAYQKPGHIRVYDKAGKVCGTIVKATESFSPCDLAYCCQDKVIVTDWHRQQVQIYKIPAANNGNLVSKQNPALLGHAVDLFKGISGIAVDEPLGRIIVTDTVKNMVMILATDGKVIATIGFQSDIENLHCPVFVTVDSFHRIIVSDCVNHSIQVYDQEGRQLFRLGSHGSNIGQLSYPSGIKTDHHGNIVVADSGNNRIVSYPPNSSDKDKCRVVLSLDESEVVWPHGLALYRNTMIALTNRHNSMVMNWNVSTQAK